MIAMIIIIGCFFESTSEILVALSCSPDLHHLFIFMRPNENKI